MPSVGLLYVVFHESFQQAGQGTAFQLVKTRKKKIKGVSGWWSSSEGASLLFCNLTKIAPTIRQIVQNFPTRCRGGCDVRQSVSANNSIKVGGLLDLLDAPLQFSVYAAKIHNNQNGKCRTTAFAFVERDLFQSLNPPPPFFSENVWLHVRRLLNSSAVKRLMWNQQPRTVTSSSKNSDDLIMKLNY